MKREPDWWPIDRPLPSYLTGSELRQVLRISETQFYEMKKLGLLKIFLANPVVNQHAPYSGLIVDQHRRGQFTYARSFGGRNRRRTA